MDPTRRRHELTPLSQLPLPVDDRTLDLRRGNCDQDGLWRPGLIGLARSAGITLKQARQRVRDQGPAYEQARQQERLRQHRLSLLQGTWARAGVPPVFREVTYPSLSQVALYDAQALQACQDWSSGRGVTRGLLLRGSAGNGKTSLAVAALRDFVERTSGRRPVRFQAMSDLLLQLQQQFREHGADGAQSLWQLLSPYTALVIDEFGRRRLTDWVQEQLHMLFDVCWREGKRLIVTTNIVDPDQFDAVLEPATQSRLYAMCQEIHLFGPDYRLQDRPRSEAGPQVPRPSQDET